MLRMIPTLKIGLLAVSLATGAGQAWGQSSRNEPKARVGAPHLVGHEDLALLDRVQDLIDDWDPRKLSNPIVRTTYARGVDGRLVAKKQLRRSDLAEFIADIDAAEALGKAFFWDMRAGSDFGQRRVEGEWTVVGTACATCHFRHGADARGRYTDRPPHVLWEGYQVDPAHDDGYVSSLPRSPGNPFGRRPFEVANQATSAFPFQMYASTEQGGPLDLIVGSTGVEPRHFLQIEPSEMPPDQEWAAERSSGRDPTGINGTRADYLMFIDGWKTPDPADDHHYRQITTRNSPTIINAVFSDRLFHDGRAESTFNGFSIFGDRDKREVIHRSRPLFDANGLPRLDQQGLPLYGDPVPVHVAITKAALASQAVGPIVNDVEMSYSGRTFPHVACRMLDAKILEHQRIHSLDSHLGNLVAVHGYVSGADASGCDGKGIDLTYRELIQRAFRREWWDVATAAYEDLLHVPANHPDDQGLYAEQVANHVRLELVHNGFVSTSKQIETAYTGELMHANFPLYWGLSIMLYEASLVSAQTPFDEMMRGESGLVEQRWEEVKHHLGDVWLDRSPTLAAPLSKTGSAVFQQGFRTFMRSGCIECHDGPLMSELSERLVEVEKQGIDARLSRTLLTNSRADAIAIEKNRMRDEVTDTIAGLLESNHGVSGLNDRQARELARQCELLREEARGSEPILASLLEQRLRPLQLEGHAADIAKRLIDFERKVALRFGQRPFFTEEQRQEYVGELVDPVQIEDMRIPDELLVHRPAIPFNGTHARFPAVFYDLGFYVLGVAPPRYDRGNGGFEGALSVDQAARKLLDAPDADNLSASERSVLEDVAQGKYASDGDPVKQETLEGVLGRLGQQREMRSDASATPGQAYRFDADWSLPRLRRDRRRDDSLRSLEFAPDNMEAREETGQVFDCLAEVTPMDEQALKEPIFESSWSRNALDAQRRRSDLLFKSRARTLVSDEEPAGYRKPFLHDNELAFWGAFRTPSLRNVELTAPYMHNGRLMTLQDVIAFYDRGGDVPADRTVNPDMHPVMRDIDFLAPFDKVALHFFLLCLTDENVRYERAPFDHPSLVVVNGYDSVVDREPRDRERLLRIDSVGRNGWSSKSHGSRQDGLESAVATGESTQTVRTDDGFLPLFPIVEP